MTRGITHQYSPFVMSDKVTISQANPYALLDTTKMRNTFKQPILLDEIVFSCADAPFNPFFYVDTQIKLADSYITDGYLPIAALGSVYNRRARDGIYNTQPLRKQFGFQTYAFEQVWRFPRAVYLAPEDDIIPVELRLNKDLRALFNLAAFVFPITVAIRCRPIPIGKLDPEEIQMPFASYWRTPFLPNQALTIVRSQKDNLNNPWAEDLQIQYLLGRVFAQFDDAVEPVQAQAMFGTVSPNPGLYQQDITVSARHYNGAQVIRDKVPFGQVFSTVDNAWCPPGVLRPQGYYIFTLAADLRAYDPQLIPSAAVDSPNFALISLLGHRTLVRR